MMKEWNLDVHVENFKMFCKFGKHNCLLQGWQKEFHEKNLFSGNVEKQNSEKDSWKFDFLSGKKPIFSSL